MGVGVRVSAGRITAGDVATLGISTVLRTSIVNLRHVCRRARTMARRRRHPMLRESTGKEKVFVQFVRRQALSS